MQDVLYFFFGISALWILMRFKSIMSLWAVAACLLLSLLAKETGVLFIAMGLLYLFWFDQRKRLYAAMAIITLPVTLYLLLRLNAIGFIGQASVVPIDKLNLAGRLFTAPSILTFYITKLVMPWKLATGYDWVYPTFSFRHVVLPFMLDLAVAGLVVYLAYAVYNNASKAMFYTYLFFASWCALGLLLIIQILPLDMTASDAWFYFSMVGFLGMLGVVMATYLPRVQSGWPPIAIGILVLTILGVSTAFRGLDWRNEYTLAYKSVSVSKEDFNAYDVIAIGLIKQGKYHEARIYAMRSISICHTFGNYETLAVASALLGDYPGAYNAYIQSLKLDATSSAFEGLGELTLVYGPLDSDKQFFSTALDQYPRDANLWMYLALLDDDHNDNANAKAAISNAARYGQVPKFIYNGIMNNKSFYVVIPDLAKTIIVS
jgi:hypothetical protein